jgi:ankyrin repeat protein
LGLLFVRDLASSTVVEVAPHCPLSGDLQMAAYLMKRGAAVDVTDDFGRSAFWWACDAGHEPLARLLLLLGADATVANAQRRTPLMAAAERGHVEVARALVGQVGCIVCFGGS